MSPMRIFLMVLAAMALLASVEFYALHRSRTAGSASAPVAAAEAPAAALPEPKAAPSSPPVNAPAAATPAPAAMPAWPLANDKATPIVGYLDTPADEVIVADALDIVGWASAPAGIAAVEVIVDGRHHAAEIGLVRDDVAAVRRDDPHAARAGFRFHGEFADLALQRHAVQVIARDREGREALVGGLSLVSPRALARWADIARTNPGFADHPFWFLMATSGVARGGGDGIAAQYRALVSPTVRIGMAVPILYMRTTKGAPGDFAFDPAFELSRKCKNRPVADDNLDGVIAFALAQRLPVQFILNGGIWGDASCESLEWDLTDHLQLDPLNCQWDQLNEVLPDDWVKGLVGSTESPLLSRSLTYNVHARSVRSYKRRNLQAAAAIVARFAREHPELFVGVSLDADTYMNPFVRDGRRFDYNPGMLRQFREWLSGTGPYAGVTAGGAPDLRAWRRAKPLTLTEVNRVAHQTWTRWEDVDPPREFPGDEGKPLGTDQLPYWQDPWYREWDVFRRHVIGLHYAELAQWTHDAGVPADRIFTAQAFTHHDLVLRPIATWIDSDATDYDSAGVSIEGAMPRVGHLGAILYGPSSENRVTMDNDRSLFATIARFDRQWAIVESNATNLKTPGVLPTYAQSYRGFRELFNFGGRQVALMAWNGSNGRFAGQPGYVPYTAFRNTPAEQAMMDFMVSHAGLPQGSLLWTFGSGTHADDDGWTATRGVVLPTNGALVIHPYGDRMRLRSPADQVIRPSSITHAELRFEGAATLLEAVAYAKLAGDDRWQAVGRSRGTTLAFEWPAGWKDPRAIVERVEFELAFAPGAAGSHLTAIALRPGR